jgi:hypothetical protein
LTRISGSEKIEKKGVKGILKDFSFGRVERVCFREEVSEVLATKL